MIVISIAVPNSTKRARNRSFFHISLNGLELIR
nr:MAG TPA: hypothetical protein [Caudoviricetes sp.]